MAASVVVEGQTVVPQGATVKGFVQKSEPSGELGRRAVIALGLLSLDVYETRVELDTDSSTHVSKDYRNRNLALIGGSARPGTADARERRVRIPAETVLAFRLREPITL
jgi:hypothetical protein